MTPPFYPVIVVVALLLLLVVFLWTVLKGPQSLRVWIGGAMSAFVSGFIEGCPVGSPAGAGIAAADGQVFADLGSRHLLIEAAHLLAVPFFTGLADVRSFQKGSPFPNIFAPSTQKDVEKPVVSTNP